MISSAMTFLPQDLPQLRHDRFTREAARLLGVQEVAVSLLLDEGVTALVAASSGVSEAFDELQFMLGVGPTWDALRTGQRVVVEDFAQAAEACWQPLCAAAAELGLATVLCVPLCAGGDPVGTVTALRPEPGPVTHQAISDAEELAAALARSLAGQGGCEVSWFRAVDPAFLARAEYHRAAGMASVQAGLDVADALLVIRSLAYGSGRSTAEVSRDILDGRLRMDGRAFGTDRSIRA